MRLSIPGLLARAFVGLAILPFVYAGALASDIGLVGSTVPPWLDQLTDWIGEVNEQEDTDD